MSRFEEHEIELLLNLLKRILTMTDIADNVVATLNAVQALATQITALAAAVQAITAPDLSGLNAKLDTIIADLNPTPAPAPTSAPAT